MEIKDFIEKKLYNLTRLFCSHQPFVESVPEIARDFFAAESDEIIILDDYDSDDLISTNDSETIDLGPAFTMNFDLGSELEGTSIHFGN